MATKPADPHSNTLANQWARYKALADSPDYFTRWMLERTHAALASYEPSAASYQQLQDIAAQLATALLADPLPPPQSVDSRVDLLSVQLEAGAVQLILDCLADPHALPLDALQARRQNPWGGFREAWLEHYNQMLLRH